MLFMSIIIIILLQNASHNYCKKTDIQMKLKRYHRMHENSTDEEIQRVIYKHGPVAAIMSFDAFKLFK